MAEVALLAREQKTFGQSLVWRFEGSRKGPYLAKRQISGNELVNGTTNDFNDAIDVTNCPAHQ